MTSVATFRSPKEVAAASYQAWTLLDNVSQIFDGITRSPQSGAMRNDDFDVDLTRLYPYPAQRRDRRNPNRAGLIDPAWYEMVKPNPNRTPAAQREIERCFQLEVTYAKWLAAQRDRRKAERAPVMTRVHVDGEAHMLACDVSSNGLRCSGRPEKGVLDLEFKIPGLAFPVDARAEVVDFKDGAVIPLVNLRFIDLDRPYREHIQAYVDRRLAAAA